MRHIAVLMLCFLGIFSGAHAEVSVLFHPHDDTFGRVVEYMKRAKSSVDLALFNIDATPDNPIVAYMQSGAFRDRIKQGTLSVRLIYEGFGDRNEDRVKVDFFRRLGVDVRHLLSSVRLHHKFGVFDGRSDKPSVISGSANWTMLSRNGYDESMLFIDDEIALGRSFAAEFDRLWAASVVADLVEETPVGRAPGGSHSPSLHAYFNSENFVFTGTKIEKRAEGRDFVLTRLLEEAISRSKRSLKIATTRILLRPLYNAIVAAAKRKVKVTIVVGQDQYESEKTRTGKELPDCPDEYRPSCSANSNYAAFLDRDLGKDADRNVEVRVKFYNLNPSAYFDKQMHSKYVIVDDETVYTGSFNWSYSSEYRYLENIVVVDRARFPKVVERFQQNFSEVFGANRGEYEGFYGKIKDALEQDKDVDCTVPPMALSFGEIDKIVALDTIYPRGFADVCQQGISNSKVGIVARGGF